MNSWEIVKAFDEGKIIERKINNDNSKSAKINQANNFTININSNKADSNQREFGEFIKNEIEKAMSYEAEKTLIAIGSY